MEFFKIMFCFGGKFFILTGKFYYHKCKTFSRNKDKLQNCIPLSNIGRVAIGGLNQYLEIF